VRALSRSQVIRVQLLSGRCSFWKNGAFSHGRDSHFHAVDWRPLYISFVVLHTKQAGVVRMTFFAGGSNRVHFVWRAEKP
jgi:hypothetical protein